MGDTQTPTGMHLALLINDEEWTTRSIESILRPEGFTEEGQVSVAAQRSDRGRVAFSVRDSGRGIAPEVQSQLFQPFQRSRDGDNPFFAQAGLGLSIARRLVRAMGSDLTFESELDKGTVFSFTLDLPSV